MSKFFHNICNRKNVNLLMAQTIILIFAVLVPVVIAVLILRAWKKYDHKDYGPQSENTEDNKTDN